MRLPLQISHSTKIFIGITLAYLALTFLLPASVLTKAEYHLSDSQYYFLLFTVRLPIVALWCTVFYASRLLYKYAKKIHHTPEGEDFAMLARSMQWIAWGLPIPAFIGMFLNAIANKQPDFLAVASITISYMYVIVAVVAFTLMGAAAHRLSQRAHVQLGIKHIRVILGLLVTAAVVFCYLISTKLYTGGLHNSYNIYYLPNWMVWTTIVIPYLYAWFIGLFAALEILLTARRTSGVIYRQALTYLAAGIVTIILALCALQYFRSIVPRSGHLTIGMALMTTYSIYGIIASGCVLLIVGIKRLLRIEEV